MSPAPYRIAVDPARKLLTAELSGFWDADTARAFNADEQAAVARITSRPRQHLVLADLSGLLIQSQEVVALLQDLIAHARLPARRVALVSGDGLFRIQVRRLLVRDELQVFTARADALGWLFAADRKAA